MLCIGSSLEVYPVAQLPGVTLGRGGALAILTQGATPLDRRATVRLHGDVVHELTALLGALGLEPRRRPRTGARPARVSAAPPPGP